MTVTVNCAACEKACPTHVPTELIRSVDDALFAALVAHQIEAHLHEIEVAS